MVREKNTHVELQENISFWNQMGQEGLAVAIGAEGPGEQDMQSRRRKHVQNLRSAQPW